MKAQTSVSTFPLAKPGETQQVWARRRLAALLAGAFAFRMAVAPVPGYRLDFDDFTAWARALSLAGPRAIYTPGAVPPVNSPVDYPPAYLLVLWATGLVHAALGGADLGWRLLLKFPPICADLVVIALVYAIVRRTRSESQALLAGAIAAFAPVLWYDSAYWGQVDSLPLALALGALYVANETRMFAAWTFLAIAVLIKPPLAVLVPVLGILQIRAARTAPLPALRELSAAVCCSLGLAYVLTLPFTALRAPLDVFRFLSVPYADGLGKVAVASKSAFNLYTIGGPFSIGDGVTFAGIPLRVLGIALVLASVAFVSVAYARSLQRGSDRAARDAALLSAASLCSLSLFILATRMHERYLLPALVLGLPFALDDMPTAAAFGWLTLAFVIDCQFSIAGFHGGAHHRITVFIAHAVSLGNVLAFLLILERFRRRFAL